MACRKMTNQVEENEVLDAILMRIAGKYFLADLISDPPLLGEKNASDMRLFVEKMEASRLDLIEEVRALDYLKHFDTAGRTENEEANAWLISNYNSFTPKLSSLFEWHKAALGAEEFMADVDHWSKMPFLKTHEALWLSVGLEPQNVFIESLPRKGREPEKVASEVQFMLRRKEVFRREFNPHGYDQSFGGTKILEWVQRVGLDIHPRFDEILRAMVRAESTSKTSKQSEFDECEAQSKRPDKREIDKIAQLFAAMAIDNLGYDPSAKRSPVPREIEEFAATMGLEVSSDTIRKYLKLGTSFIPESWEPGND